MWTRYSALMSQATILAVVALAASVLLVLQLPRKLYPVIALVVSAIEVLMALGYVRLSVAGVPLPLVLGCALAISGVLIWLQCSAKAHVSAATLVAGVGLMQVLTKLF